MKEYLNYWLSTTLPKLQNIDTLKSLTNFDCVWRYTLPQDWIKCWCIQEYLITTEGALRALLFDWSPVACTPCVWTNVFWSFLTKTKQDQTLQSHVRGKIWPHGTHFLLGSFFLLVISLWHPGSGSALGWAFNVWDCLASPSKVIWKTHRCASWKR